MKRTHRTIAAAAAITAAAAIAAGPAQAAKGAITLTYGGQSSPVSSYSWGATTPATAHAGGGGGAGKVEVQDLKLVKDEDAMSVALAQATFTGLHAPTASLTFTAGPFTSAYCFKDVLVTSFQTAATSGQDRPVDQFSLSFAQVGFKVGIGSFNWDITGNVGTDNPC